jgi:hypothetical protein
MGKRLPVDSSNTTIESQWWTCGVSRKRSMWRPSSSRSPSMKLRTRSVSTPKLAAFSWIESAEPPSSAPGASRMKRSMPPFSSPSQWRSTRFASLAGSSTSRMALRMFYNS